MRNVYCGGRFEFDYLREGYRDQAARDYRAVLLKDVNLLLRHSGGVKIHEEATYIGPFYFESEGMEDQDIVRTEREMIRGCTDAVFLLDEAACPGTICELTAAAMLGKRLHIFYIRKPDEEETESTLHTPCWYPILHSLLVNRQTALYPCEDPEQAALRIREVVDSWKIR